MNDSFPIAVAASFAVAALGISVLLTTAPETPRRAVWAEIAWPFPIDPWGRGRAFQCRAADCGTEVQVYVRAKLGFCNCVTGIANDGDLDAMGDLALLGADTTPRGAGRPVEVGWMKGRARSYAATTGGVLSVAFNDRCDMVVATATTRQANATVEAHVVEFLNSAPMLDWTKARLGI